MALGFVATRRIAHEVVDVIEPELRPFGGALVDELDPILEHGLQQPIVISRPAAFVDGWRLQPNDLAFILLELISLDVKVSASRD